MECDIVRVRGPAVGGAPHRWGTEPARSGVDYRERPTWEAADLAIAAEGHIDL